MKKILGSFLISLMVMINAPLANAQIIVSPTVQELLNGNSITVLDKVFSDWQLLEEKNSVTPTNWSNVTLERLDNDPFDPGLAFFANGEFTSQVIDFQLLFTVSTIDGSALIKDLSMELVDLYASVGGTVMSINTFLLDTDALNPVIVSNLDAYKFDSESFTPVASTRVQMNFYNGDPNSALNRFDLRVSQISAIPEPATLALMGLGLVGLHLLRRKKLRE